MQSQRSNIQVTDEPMWRSIGVPTGGSIYVMVNGSDTEGVAYKITSPFASVNAAITAAVAGDTVFIYPGTYVDPDGNSIILKDGVNIYLHLGAIISANSTFAIFDNGSSVTCAISGDGTLMASTNPTVGILGASSITLKGINIISDGTGIVLDSACTCLLQNVKIVADNIGISYNSAASALTFNNVTIVAPASIDTSVAVNIKVYSLRANNTISGVGSVTNLITGTTFIIDSDVS